MQIRRKVDYSTYIAVEAAKKDSGKAAYAVVRAAKDYGVFASRFARYKPFIGQRAVCLGARLGTEVKALRALGIAEAFGIDIAEYPGSEHTVHGDFMNLTYPDNSFDFTFTNCFDHTYDPLAFFKGVARVTKPGGFMLIDVVGNVGGDWGAYTIWHPDSLDEIPQFIEAAGGHIVGLEPIERPFAGISFLIKWKDAPTAEDREHFEAARMADKSGELGPRASAAV